MVSSTIKLPLRGQLKDKLRKVMKKQIKDDVNAFKCPLKSHVPFKTITSL